MTPHYGRCVTFVKLQILDGVSPVIARNSAQRLTVDARAIGARSAQRRSAAAHAHTHATHTGAHT